MKKLFPIALIAAVLGLIGCDSSSTPAPLPDAPQPPPPPTSTVQVLHAVPDGPAVNVSFNGFAPPAGSELLAIDYKGGTSALTVNSGDVTVQVDGLVAGGTTTTLIPSTPATLEEGMLYNIVAIGDAATIAPLVLAQSETVTAGSARARILHAAPGAPAVDIFVTAPAADLTASMPVASLAFGEDAPPVEVAPGDYQIRVTLVGMPAMEVFDSGTITLNDGDDLLVAAVDNTTTSLAPITLAVLNGTGASEILDVATPANVRVVHASPDAGLVDVLADGGELFTDLAYPTASMFMSVDAGTYDIAVTPADDPATVAIDLSGTTLNAGESYTVIALDVLATITALVSSDDYRPVAGESKVRLVHGAPTAGDVDIYLTAVGADLSMETPIAAGVPFQADTGFGSFASGMYDLSITETGTTNVAIAATITLAEGGVYTAVARDPDPAVMMDTFGLILMDDFVP